MFARADDFHARVAHRRHITGAVLAPFSAWLTLRGCRSLPARMAWHCANARKVAKILATHPAIERVNYPGLASHAGHAIAARQMSDFGAMLSIELRGSRETTLAMAGKLRLFTNATSLGGCESLVEHRASVEGPNPVSPQNLLRVSVGLEHARRPDRGPRPSAAVRRSALPVPVLGIDMPRFFGGNASPCCSNSIEIRSGERTKAMWPSRGGRLMVKPIACRCAQVA